jgi:phospholipid-transporting ATPase
MRLNLNLKQQILNVREFNSTPKRMSTIIRTPEGKTKLYCKGADTVVLDLLAKNQLYTEKTLLHLEVRFVSYFSSQIFVQMAHRCCSTARRTDGLWTLCLAFRDIPAAEYKQWAAICDRAAATINGRGDALDEAAESIEKDMFLLGTTVIEDKLQDGVTDTIHTLQAGICF